MAGSGSNPSIEAGTSQNPSAESASPLAFVGGATGYTGRFVVEALRARGITTVAHVRPDSSSRADWQKRFEALGAQVDFTPWDQAALRATFARLQPTLVFALLGTTQARGNRVAKSGAASAVADNYEAVDYGLTILLLQAAASLPQSPRFVYLSSLGADNPRSNRYLDVRHRIETRLKEGGVPYTVARPSFITGEDRDEHRPMEKWGARVADGVLGALGALGAATLRDRYTSLSGSELGEALVIAGLGHGHRNAILQTEQLRSLLSGVRKR